MQHRPGETLLPRIQTLQPVTATRGNTLIARYDLGILGTHAPPAARLPGPSL
ncbi:hypothetical protein PQD13_gp23 [Gordonia phage Clawz]|uniref:Uncharacterized protein n=1 Tax=Gordonia phage Clawz TaxID=2743910 RepID=A0AAE7FAD7_9CAUD|nr:hypothetical protein PQD13_gp23 [Gordonia phage Clawz]QKY79935.1 hypothetical protein SEA_CLAWZ_23 [Gordonia phage Clawz]